MPAQPRLATIRPLDSASPLAVCGGYETAAAGGVETPDGLRRCVARTSRYSKELRGHGLGRHPPNATPHYLQSRSPSTAHTTGWSPRPRNSSTVWGRGPAVPLPSRREKWPDPGRPPKWHVHHARSAGCSSAWRQLKPRTSTPPPCRSYTSKPTVVQPIQYMTAHAPSPCIVPLRFSAPPPAWSSCALLAGTHA